MAYAPYGHAVIAKGVMESAFNMIIRRRSHTFRLFFGLVVHGPVHAPHQGIQKGISVKHRLLNRAVNDQTLFEDMLPRGPDQLCSCMRGQRAEDADKED